MLRQSSLSLLCLLLVACGCSRDLPPSDAPPAVTTPSVALPPETVSVKVPPNAIGTWKFKSLELGVQSNNPQALAAASALQAAHPAIQFSSNHRYVVSGDVPETGKWSIAGNTVTMKVETINGKSLQQIRKKISAMEAKDPNLSKILAKANPLGPKTVVISDDGKQIRLKSKVLGGGDQIFVRSVHK